MRGRVQEIACKSNGKWAGIDRPQGGSKGGATREPGGPRGPPESAAPVSDVRVGARGQQPRHRRIVALLGDVIQLAASKRLGCL